MAKIIRKTVLRKQALTWGEGHYFRLAILTGIAKCKAIPTMSGYTHAQVNTDFGDMADYHEKRTLIKTRAPEALKSGVGMIVKRALNECWSRNLV
jgi:hypothetical protein